MRPRRERRVAPADYHIRTRSASRNANPVGNAPRAVVISPESDSEEEERPTRRLRFDILPPREQPEIQNPPFLMDPDLAQALTNFTNGAAQDRAQYQGRHDMLVNMLLAQQRDSADLRALLAAQQQQVGARVNNAVVDSIPIFEGKVGDSGRDWIRKINDVGDAEMWNNVQKRQVAIRRLGGIALQWHLQSGANYQNWLNWSAALGNNFTFRLSPSEWYKMIEEKIQKPGEPGIVYAVEKSRLLDLSPHVLTNAQKVSYLINGLANWHHVAAMMNDTPADVDAFMTRLRELETQFATLRPNVSPVPPANPSFQPPPPPAYNPLGAFQMPTLPPAPTPPQHTGGLPQQTVDVGTALLSMGNQIAGLVDKLNGLTIGGGQRQMQRQPDNRACFQCGATDHFRRNCPRAAGNGQAPSAGQGPR